MLPKSGRWSLSITNGWPLVVLAWNYQFQLLSEGECLHCARIVRYF